MSIVRAAMSREEFAVTWRKNCAREGLMSSSCGSTIVVSCMIVVAKWMKAERDTESEGSG